MAAFFELTVCASRATTAVLLTNILHIYGFDSIRILFEGVKSPKHRQLPGKFDPKDVSLSACKMAVESVRAGNRITRKSSETRVTSVSFPVL